MKLLGAQIIGLGIIMLALDLVGMRLRLFWFLDMLGPVVAVALKLGVVALGIWIWRGANGGPAVEDEGSEGDGQRAWVPVAGAGLVIAGLVLYFLVHAVRD